MTPCSITIHSSVTVGTKGQIVIPKDVRELLGIEEGEKLVVITKDNIAVGLIKTDDFPKLLSYLHQESQK